MARYGKKIKQLKTRKREEKGPVSKTGTATFATATINISGIFECISTIYFYQISVCLHDVSSLLLT